MKSFARPKPHKPHDDNDDDAAAQAFHDASLLSRALARLWQRRIDVRHREHQWQSAERVCMRRQWARFRHRVHQQGHHRWLMRATRESFGSALRLGHSGSRNSSQTRTRYNESFAYRQEVRKVHERLRGYCQGQQRQHALTPHDFLVHCVRAWGLASGDGGHFGPNQVLPYFSSSLSSSSSSSASTISSSSWGAAATSQVLVSRVGEAWFLRRWLWRWQPRARLHLTHNAAQRFHYRHLGHVGLATLFSHRLRRRQIRLGMREAEAFHTRRLARSWEPIAKKRRHQLLEAERALTSFSSSLLEENDDEEGCVSSSCFSFLSASSSPFASTTTQATPPFPPREALPVPELRLVQHRVLAALDAACDRHARTSQARGCAMQYQTRQAMQKWSSWARVRARAQHVHMLAGRVRDAHQVRASLRRLVFRTGRRTQQRLCLHTAECAWARRHLTLALWRVGLQAHQQSYHAWAVDLMERRMRLQAVTRAMKLLKGAAAPSLSQLDRVTTWHDTQRAARAWQHLRRGARGRQARRRAQLQALAVQETNQLHMALVRRWRPHAQASRRSGEALALAARHARDWQRRRFLLQWKRRFTLQARFVALARRSLLHRTLLAWWATVQRDGERRAMELALACRQELLLQRLTFHALRAWARRQAHLRMASLVVAERWQARVLRSTLQYWARGARVQWYEGERWRALVHAYLTTWMLHTQARKAARRNGDLIAAQHKQNGRQCEDSTTRDNSN